MNMSNVGNIRTAILKFWPIVVAACGAIYYLSTGDYAHALGVLGLGGAATLTGDSLHREPVPVPVQVPIPVIVVEPAGSKPDLSGMIRPIVQGEGTIRGDRPS
jgi:hypothetical protein